MEENRTYIAIDLKATPHNYTMNLRIRGTFSECLYCP